MIEIRYGEHYEMADLTGRSIAQAREQYKQEFGIPDKAQASLNGKGIRQKHEPKTALGDNDNLTFAQKSRKGLFFIGAILLALAITGGIFAYGQTTATITLGVTTAKNFVVAAKAASEIPAWTVYGKYKGKVDPGNLFTVTPAANFNGDMVALVHIANGSDLVKVYRVLAMQIEVTGKDTGGKSQIWPAGVEADYTTGTAAFTSDSKVVVGTDTTWTTAMVGRRIRNDATDKWYTIASVTDATNLTLTEEAGEAISGAYTIRDIGVALLSLDKGVVEIELTGYEFGATPTDMMVKLAKGWYVTHHWVTAPSTDDASPLLYCDVVQKGAMTP